MAGERETAAQMFRRHERERMAHVLHQIDRLNGANFDWVLPEHFRAQLSYEGKGLVITDNSREEVFSSRISTVLDPGEGLLIILPNGRTSSHNLSILPPSRFVDLEQRVDETLAGLQAARVPA